MSMHLRSVKSFLYVNTGEEAKAAELLREIIILAKETNDWWVLGDAYFDLFCIAKLDKVELLVDETFESLYSQLQSVADVSGLPHLQFKAKVMQNIIAPDKNGAVQLLNEARDCLIDRSLAGTDSLTILYLCYLIYSELFPDSDNTKFLYDTILYKAEQVDLNNPGIGFAQRNKIVKLLRIK